MGPENTARFRLFGTEMFGVITGMMLKQPTMTGREPRNDTTSPYDSPVDPLLSDEPTIELVMKAQGGDRLAVEALLQRCLPQLKRWAHGKLPAAARGSLDTGDLVQEAAMHVVQRLDVFQPRHVGAMQAYLRMSVLNRIRDEIRRVGRHPAPVELPEGARQPQAARPRNDRCPGRGAVEHGRNRPAVRDAHRRRGAHGGDPRAQE